MQNERILLFTQLTNAARILPFICIESRAIASPRCIILLHSAEMPLMSDKLIYCEHDPFICIANTPYLH